jgi:sugar lactone lactonase YvrE
MRTRLTWMTAFLIAFFLVHGSAQAFTLDSGDILISNHGGNNVQRLQPSTGTVSTLTSISSTPIGLAFDTNFNLYINSGDVIFELNKTTNVVTTFFTSSVGTAEGLTFDPITGHLFSARFGTNTVQEIDLNGNLVRNITVTGASSVIGITARGGLLLVTDFSTGKVFEGTTTGSSFALVGTVDPGNTYAVDIDNSSNIYVNDFGTGKVIKFTPSGGSFIASDFITGLSAPANGLSIGDDGSFTISEFGGSAISIWNSDGTLRKRFTGVSNPDELVVFAPVRQSGGGGGAGVPEPGSLILLTSGIAGIAGVAWRQRRRQQAESV